MLSATPGDVWINYLPVFLAHGFFKNKSEFVSNHVVYNPYVSYPMIQRYVNTDHLMKLRKHVEVIMEDKRHTNRIRKFVDVLYNEEQYILSAKERWDIYNDEPVKNSSQYRNVLRRIVNESQDRIWQAMWIISAHDRIIVFYNYNYELDILKDICNTLNKKYYERNGHKHDALRETDDEWVYLIQYSSGAEGWNCITTNVILFYSLNYAWRVHEQCEGRIDRVNTKYTDLEYFYLVSNSQIDRDIQKALINKKEFNYSSYKIEGE